MSRTVARPSTPLRTRSVHLLGLLTLLSALVAGLLGPAGARADDEDGVTVVTGSFEVTNPFVFDTTTEPIVLLTDLVNFIDRDMGSPLPIPGQVTATLQGDLPEATYTLPLPIAPQGTVNDVAWGEGGDGVQVYSIDLWANFVGVPSIDPVEGTGWSTAYTSLEVAYGTNEITGGKLVVWAPDDEQAFPTGFGDDGRLFTDDDPIDDIPAGWTVVDLDAEPFDLVREPVAEVNILEGDGALKDYSDLSFTEAFDALVEDLRLRYPFTDFKEIDWDALVEEFRPLVEEAEDEDDLDAFHVAMMGFVVAIGDGHVSIEPNIEYVVDQYGGGLGLTLGETDDGEVIVTTVADDSPADEAGIEPGAEILAWNDEEIGDVVATTPLVFSASSPHATRLQQLTLLARGEVGDDVELTFANPDEDEETVELSFVGDIDGLILAFDGEQDWSEMPVTVEVLPSGYGYVRVNTFMDDMVLMTHAWEWALKRLTELEVPGLIVDVRGNGGGSGQVATYFAGSFYDEEFELAESYYADEEGEFVHNMTETVYPSPVQWEEPVAVLIDEGCASACEIFSAAMAHDPDHLIVGHTPTAGVEAGIYPWALPGDLYFQASIEYFEVDGEVWIEGVGVPPTVDVPVTVESLLSDEDVVLAAAEAALS